MIDAMYNCFFLTRLLSKQIMLRCLLLPGRAAAQEEKEAAVLAAAATAAGLLQTQTTRQPARIPGERFGHSF